MGLAASQGRYLCLTARNSDLVYEGQQISQQRMALAKETQAVANEYNEAMSNTVMRALLPGQESQQLTYDLLTNQDPLTGLCMRVVDLDGNVVIPGEYLEITEVVGEGEEQTKTTSVVTSSSDFVNRYMSDLVDGDTALKLSMKSLTEVSDYYNQTFTDTGITTRVVDKSNSNIVQDGEKVTTDPFCSDPEYLQEMLTTGQYLLQQAGAKGVWEEFVWQGSSAISEEYDTTDDAAAEAKYESAMVELQRKDKLLELRLEQVQTEQSAVEKEMESVKDIIGKNIENGFKTFA
ncbi:MAG: hypothetical protein IJY61_08385 [Candidatus Gastranaerophilales bacterium]|nr:hypothetical protein [Candidatus Gastranaerophilales bacterium]